MFTLGLGTRIVEVPVGEPCSYEGCDCTLQRKEVCMLCGCDWFRFSRTGELRCGFCEGPIAEDIRTL